MLHWLKMLPLSGIKIVDLSHLLPGPLCTLMLADLGASVTKIERPPYGDLNRRIPPFHKGLSSYFMMLNRDKKCTFLDLKSKQGKQKFLKLIKSADILVENFRPDVLNRLGIGYDVLKKINPGLIYCAITGYGHTGPMKKAAGHDLNYVALSGVLGGMVPKKGGVPPMLPTQLSDIVGGSLMPAISILAALELRRKTKKGLFIDSAMMPGTMVLLMMVLGKYFLTGEDMFQGDDRMTGKYLNYSIYETQDKKAMALAAIEPKFWNRFCEVVSKEEWKSWLPLSDAPGFPTSSLVNLSDTKLAHLKKKVSQLFKSKTQAQWIGLFRNESDVCCTPVTNFKGAVNFLKMLGRKEFFYLKDSKNRTIPQMSFPWGNSKLSIKEHFFSA